MDLALPRQPKSSVEVKRFLWIAIEKAKKRKQEAEASMKQKESRKDKGFANQKTRAQSSRKACFFEQFQWLVDRFGEQFKGLFTGKVVHTSFDCPINLREAFKQVTKANGSSECKELCAYMAARVITSEYNKACFTNTMGVPKLVIEKLEIPTYVQSRKRRFKREVTEEEIEEIFESPTCTFCSNHAVVRAELLSSPGSKVWLCESHYQQKHARVRVLERVEGEDFQNSISKS
jgi:hypothetical protein